ncbi:TOC75-3 protein [Spatholobus suberectus]|nr:TOC75-3 protein [Spatholobus suberectus]
MDHGLGIGTQLPFFNFHQLSMTQFIQLRFEEERVGKPPPLVFVFHGHYDGCIGGLPKYGGGVGDLPLRGYKIAEIRVPIKSKYVYAFAKHVNDLGSIKVKGIPTFIHRRMGHGSSYDVGIMRVQSKERRTLEMVHREALKGLLQLLSALAKVLEEGEWRREGLRERKEEE